eukprot:Awhi_evm1s12999
MFEEFCHRHKSCQPILEDNDLMRNSYLILDEKMRFLNNQQGYKKPSRSILE